MKEIKSIEIHDGKVTVKIFDLDYWGRISRRQQMTFRRRAFEQALQQAEIVVPWAQVKP